MRLAVAATGDAPAEQLSVLWADVEMITDAQAADAALKRAQLGVPFPTIARDLGYTPQEIDAMRTQRRADVLDTTGLDLRDLAS